MSFAAAMIAMMATVFSDAGPVISSPDAYIRLIDQLRARRVGHALQQNQTLAPFIEKGEMPCQIKLGGVNEGFLPLDQCFRMTRSQPMRGLWIQSFETSNFRPGLTSLPIGVDEPSHWLDLGRVDTCQPALLCPASKVRVDRCPGMQVCAWVIEFVGRRTLYPGQFGHMGAYRYQVIVDRLISLRRVN